MGAVQWPSLSCDQDHLRKLSFPQPKESPFNINFEFNLPSDFREDGLKMLTDVRGMARCRSHWYSIRLNVP